MELDLLKKKVESREAKTKRKAEKISRKVIQKLDRTVNRAAAKGLTELTIMSIISDTHYDKEREYNSGLEAYLLSEETVRQYCENKGLKAVIKRLRGGELGEQSYTNLCISW